MRAGLGPPGLLSWEVSSAPVLEATAPLSEPRPTKHFRCAVLVTKCSFLYPVFSQSNGGNDSKLRVQVPAITPPPCPSPIPSHSGLPDLPYRTPIWVCHLVLVKMLAYVEKNLGFGKRGGIGVGAIICWNIFNSWLKTFNMGRKQKKIAYSILPQRPRKKQTCKE